MLGALCALMQQAQQDALDSKNEFDKRQVEDYFQLWNDVIGDNIVPFWMQAK
jgi:hypothetical protein